MVGDNASLAMMHDTIVYALLKGTRDSDRPWVEGGTVAFLCPLPGYDRHFAICEQYGIEMIPVALNDDGPDMDEVGRSSPTTRRSRACGAFRSTATRPARSDRRRSSGWRR